MQTILFFGDSLTAGHGLARPAQESMPALIQQKINAGSFRFEVVNAGLSGDTSAGGLRRLDYWLSRHIDIFVLELGINDVLRGIPPAETQKNLQLIIDKVKARYPNVKLAMMGMELPQYIPAAIVQQFRSIFRRIAEANQMAFLPFFLQDVAGMPHLNLRDGIHPSAAGYKMISERVWTVLKPLIEQQV